MYDHFTGSAAATAESIFMLLVSILQQLAHTHAHTPTIAGNSQIQEAVLFWLIYFLPSCSVLPPCNPPFLRQGEVALSSPSRWGMLMAVLRGQDN